MNIPNEIKEIISKINNKDTSDIDRAILLCLVVLNNKIDSLDSKIDSLRDDIDNKIDSLNDDIDNKIDNLSSDIECLSNDVSDIDNNTSNLNFDITNIEKMIDPLYWSFISLGKNLNKHFEERVEKLNMKLKESNSETKKVG